ncbi:MAG: hypothetical protein KC425_01760 [Anaerolineales bacterium]|nr:hypothetical protein [Anaerolineales bacterium]
MTNFKFAFLFGLLLLLAACGGNTANVTPAPDTLPALEPDATAEPQPTNTPTADDDAPGYPVQRPTVTPLPEGYPAAPAGRDPYPAESGFVWMIRPAGQQCAEQLDFADLQSAVDALAAEGVSVNDQGTVDLLVCEACDCPTSLHYRAQVAAADVATAELLGWTVDKP